MKRKNSIRNMILALVLCMGAVFLPVTAHAAEWEGTGKPDTVPAGAETVSEIGGKPFTPDGQATVTDNAAEADGKEFYTFTTPEGNVFYLVIDHGRESENVYFLNAVTETDLLALAAREEGTDGGSESAVPLPEACACGEKCEAGMVDTSCPSCRNDLASCKGKAAGTPKGEASQRRRLRQGEPERKPETRGCIFSCSWRWRQ